jgi:ubiquinone/menaquinone biosynthesis C-methylase UbiE
MSTETIYAAVIRICRRRHPCPGGKHLDIGAGSGELIRNLGEAISPKSFACDFHAERFAAGNTPCEKVNLNLEPLPYPDAGFELVTCSEVVEHLENYRALLREAFRVAQPGGLLIVTTPNVLNANSRVRYVCSGFANLFGPLPVRNDKLYSTGGHISPIAYFYLAHALLDAGFEKVELDIDKVQRTSVLWLAVLFPFMLVGWLRFMARERGRFKTITAENEPLVKSHFSWRVLVGRTIVLSAVKPGKAAPVLEGDAQVAAHD